MWPELSRAYAALIDPLAGVAGPIALAWTLRRLGFPWLFERPAWLTLRHPAPEAGGGRPVRVS